MRLRGNSRKTETTDDERIDSRDGDAVYQHHEDFFSARRLGIQSGRILSGIQICHLEEL